MISLHLDRIVHQPAVESPRVFIEQVERDLRRLVSDLSALLDVAQRRTIYIPSELLLQAGELLMPPERMGILGGRMIGDRFVLCTLHDVTGLGHHAHVTADSGKLTRALVSFERAGAALAGWVHSHPGTGADATAPSGIDRAQYADWIRDYTDRLVGVIVVRDGFVRLWGEAVESGRVRVQVLGDGVRATAEGRNVLKLA